MAVSKAQQKAVHKYVREKYDRINITVPKGQKDEIQVAADTVGQSINGYVTQAINERMARQGVANNTAEGKEGTP